MNSELILVYIELTREKDVSPASLECISAGRQVISEFGGKLAGLLIGSRVQDTAEEIENRGMDILFTIEDELFERSPGERIAEMIVQACSELKPTLLLMAHTANAEDLAPRVACALDTGIVTDCVEIQQEHGELFFVKPVYSSNVMARFTIATEPRIVTIRSRAYDKPEFQSERKCEVVPFAMDLSKCMPRTELIGRILEEEASGPKLSVADVVVAGGRGVGGFEGFQKIKEIADILGGAVGASRPPCDLGWIASKAQVGQTGEIVAPSVYIAVGISGSTQHIAGMSGSKTVIAINKDPEAAIFRIADYGVVGRYEDILPALKEAILEVRSTSHNV